MSYFGLEDEFEFEVVEEECLILVTVDAVLAGAQETFVGPSCFGTVHMPAAFIVCDNTASVPAGLCRI